MSVGVKAPTGRSQSDCVHEQVAKADCECPLYLPGNGLHFQVNKREYYLSLS